MSGFGSLQQTTDVNCKVMPVNEVPYQSFEEV